MYVIPINDTGPFIPPMKTLENVRFSYVFMAYRKKPVTWNGISSNAV